MMRLPTVAVVASLLLPAVSGAESIEPFPAPAMAPEIVVTSPAPLDMEKAKLEVKTRYGKAHPQIQEYVLWTAETFGRGGMWLNEDAFAAMPEAERTEKVAYLAELFEESEYGRFLCRGLVEASAIRDPRLVPGLMKVAGYHRSDSDYDCRPKWMAVAALARQESDKAVPLLISLTDHGNQNTRHWARAALARKTGRDFGDDKREWADWWEAQGHEPVPAGFLEPWGPPVPVDEEQPEKASPESGG